MTKKNLYIISGCNGAGKTTLSYTILPDIIKCKEFINADEIAKGISPFQPEKIALEAGRIMLNRINELINNDESFAFETTLSTKSYKNKILEAKGKGYSITLLFLWLKEVELAKNRVKIRVSEGGHHIDEEIIERRYYRGIKNLFELYLQVVDSASIYDNSEGKFELMAQKLDTEEFIIFDQLGFNELKKQYGKS